MRANEGKNIGATSGSAAADTRPAAQPGPRRSSLSASAVVIGLVSLFADISTEVMYPLLPRFITVTLGAPASALGLIEGTAQGVSSAISGVAGWLSDRLGRRKAVAFAGYALTAISKPFIGASGSWAVVLAARFADRFGKGVRGAPRDALLADSMPAPERGLAFGFERAMDSAGAVIGPLLAALLIGGGMRDRTIFYLATIPAAIAACLILAVKEDRRQSRASGQNLRLSLAGTTRDFRRFLIVTAVFGLANSSNTFLILRATSIGMGTGLTILAYALFNAVSSLVSMPAGSASDRLGRRNILIVGYAIYALVYLGFALVGSNYLIWLLFAAYGLFPALTDGVGKALAVDTSGTAGRATAIGIYSTAVGITQIIASLSGGILWDRVNPQATFYMGAVLSGMAVFLLPALLPAKQKPGGVNEG